MSDHSFKSHFTGNLNIIIEKKNKELYVSTNELEIPFIGSFTEWSDSPPKDVKYVKFEKYSNEELVLSLNGINV